MWKNKIIKECLILYATIIAIISLASCKKTLLEVDLKGWNLVIITIDAVDHKRLGCYGGEEWTTPFLDSLAKQGLLIEYAYCPTGSTAPSHASMLTSLLPERHGCASNGNPIDPRTWNLPGALLERGYETIGWTRAFFMSKENNFARGFKYFYSKPYSNPSDENTEKDCNLTDIKQIRAFFEKSDMSRPFFAWLHLKGGHWPLVPIDSKYLSRNGMTSSPEKLPPVPMNMDSKLEYLSSDSPINNDSPYLEQLRKYYDCNLSEMDDALRSIMGFFESEGKIDNTLFVIAADHGETFENGIIGQHAPSPYESTMRIPIILWTSVKGIMGGERIDDRIVSIADIAPTVLRLLGFGDVFPEKLDGLDILAKTNKRYSIQGSFSGTYLYEYEISKWKELRVDQNKTREESQAYWNMAEKTEKEQWIYYVQYQYDSLSRIIMKLIYTQAGPYKYRIPPKRQLFNLSQDPREKIDLLTRGAEFGNIAQDLFDELRRTRPLAGWTTDLIKSPFDLPDLSTKAEFLSRQLKLDEVTIERLKSLGYLR